MSRVSETQGITERIRSYLVDYLCPELGRPVSDLKIQWPERGERSNLNIVHSQGRPLFVVRWFTSRSEGAELLTKYHLANSFELPIPPIIHSDITRQHHRKHGFSVIVEELILGQHLDPNAMTRDQFTGLATLLSKMHENLATHEKSIHSMDNNIYYRRVIMSRIRNRLSGIKKHDPAFVPGWKKIIISYFREFSDRWNDRPCLTLIHDKINPGNILYGLRRGMILLDLANLHFGGPGKDLVAALNYFCSTKDQESQMLKAYFSRVPPLVHDHFQRLEPMYRAWYHLSRWASKSRSYYKNPDNRRTEHHRERDRLFSWINHSSEYNLSA
jgi:hypothetical protein